MDDFKKNGPDLTICVPTFNRGEKTKNLVDKALRELEGANAISLLVLDNASDAETTAYEDVAQMAKVLPNLTYVRHDKNRFVHGNLLACFELADSPYIMIVSDEDCPKIEFIKNALPRLFADSALTVLRGTVGSEDGASPMNAIQLKTERYAAGADALLNFTLINNYFSGTIYNRRSLTKLGVVDRWKKNLEANRAYPHLYLEILASAISDVETSSDVCCVEGPPQRLTRTGPNLYLPPYSIGARLDQFVTLRDGFREAVALIDGSFDTGLFVTSYIRLCEKYFYLITLVNGPMYARNRINPEVLCESLFSFFIASIVIFPEVGGLQDAVTQELSRLKDGYIKLWRKFIKDLNTGAENAES